MEGVIVGRFTYYIHSGLTDENSVKNLLDKCFNVQMFKMFCFKFVASSWADVPNWPSMLSYELDPENVDGDSEKDKDAANRR